MQPIAEFSELGDFLNMPVRYYSAGMMVRLAFSIATAIDPEILIVDEVLSAGDLAFQTKARERMRALMSTARAVIVVSHDLASLPLLCDRVLWLDHGKMRMIGPTRRSHRGVYPTSQRGAHAAASGMRHVCGFAAIRDAHGGQIAHAAPVLFTRSCRQLRPAAALHGAGLAGAGASSRCCG